MSKLDFEKKLQHLESVISTSYVRSIWVTDWLTPDRKVPPNFGPLRIVRFWKIRAFWKAYVLDNAGWSKFGTPPPWNSKFFPFLAIFPPFQFPLFLAYLNLSDFDKWGIFGKLTTWTMRDTQILGPHPTRIHNFPPFPPLTPVIWSHIGHNVWYVTGITIMSSFHKCLC